MAHRTKQVCRGKGQKLLKDNTIWTVKGNTQQQNLTISTVIAMMTVEVLHCLPCLATCSLVLYCDRPTMTQCVTQRRGCTGRMPWGRSSPGWYCTCPTSHPAQYDNSHTHHCPHESWSHLAEQSWQEMCINTGSTPNNMEALMQHYVALLVLCAFRKTARV
jgi:hypothetical protein